jgi:TATA-binding protein-associated factor Taf7
MAVQEVSFIIDWSVWVPIAIAMGSLALTVYQMRKKAGRDSIDDVDKKIDRALKALKECEANLKQCGHEKDELRREKFSLLEQIAGMVRSGSSKT